MWVRENEGFSCRLCKPGQSSDRVLVTRAELSSVDTAIPEILDAMLEHRSEGPNPATTVVGQWLRVTLKHKAGLTRKIESYSGLHLVDELLDIEPSDIHKVVCLKVLKYQLRSKATQDTSRRINFATNVRELWIDIPPSWLDDNYPGWKERLDMAVALDVTGKDRINYVCDSSTPTLSRDALSVDLDISYD